MSTAGTLYDKEIRLGYAKLLASANVAGINNIVFSAALINTAYDVYYLDFNKVRPSAAGDRLIMYVSDDNGATLKTTGYYFSHQYTVSHGGAGGVQKYPGDINYPYFSLTLNGIEAAYQAVGGVTFYRGAGGGYNAPVTWHITTVQDTTFWTVHVIGGGWNAGVNVNYLLIGCASNAVFSDGFIRLYGLRKGA